MSLEELKKIKLKTFNGVFDRGDPSEVDLTHLTDALNVKFLSTGKVYTRGGLSRSMTLANGAARFFLYKFELGMGAAYDQLTQLLMTLDSTGTFRADYPSGTPIGTLPVWLVIPTPLGTSLGQDFVSTILFNRLFTGFFNRDTSANGLVPVSPLALFDPNLITPFTSIPFRATGCYPPINNEDGSGNFTLAAGPVPVLPNLPVDAGVHRIWVVYQTDTGYLSYPGPVVSNTVPDFYANSFTADGTHGISVTNAPTRASGGSGGNIVKAYFLMTMADLTEAFFVPDRDIVPQHGPIPFNVNIFCPDSDLIASADYLFNRRINSPRVIGCIQYSGRLVTWSGAIQQSSSAPNDVIGGGSTLIISSNSTSGGPEAFDNTTGFYICHKDDGYYITTCFVQYQNLYICKNYGVYSVSDNNQEPAFWDTPSTVDAAVSIPIHGVASLASTQTGLLGTQGLLVVADRSGLLAFDGAFRKPELTWKIENIWKRVNSREPYWHLTQLVIDPLEKCIYCAVALDGATVPTHVLFGDYSLAPNLEPARIKWDLWQFQTSPDSIGVIDLYGDQDPFFRFTTRNANSYLWLLDSTVGTDDGVAIPSYAQTYYSYYAPKKTLTYEGWIHFFNAMKARVYGLGNMQVSFFGLDNGKAIVKPNFYQLMNAPGRGFAQQFNFQDEKMAVKLELSSGKFNLDQLEIYCNPMWQEYPGGKFQ